MPPFVAFIMSFVVVLTHVGPVNNCHFTAQQNAGRVMDTVTQVYFLFFFFLFKTCQKLDLHVITVVKAGVARLQH